MIFHLSKPCLSNRIIINGADGVSIIGSSFNNIEDIDQNIIIDANKLNFINQRQETSSGKYRNLCKVVIGSQIWEKMDTVFSSCDIMLANFTQDPHIKITTHGSCDEISSEENVLISQVFQPNDGSDCLIKTIIKNQITNDTIDGLSDDKHVAVFSENSIFMANTKIETVVGDILNLHVSNGNIQTVNGNVLNAVVKRSEISKINGEVLNALVSNSQIDKINGKVGDLEMIQSICDTINGQISNLKMTNNCEISKINGGVSYLRMTNNCNISKINGNISSLTKTLESNVSKINGHISETIIS